VNGQMKVDIRYDKGENSVSLEHVEVGMSCYLQEAYLQNLS